MADPSKIYGNELEQMLGTGPFGMDPAETKIGAFGQGILGGVEYLGELGNELGLNNPAGPIAGMSMAIADPFARALASPTEYGQAKIDQEQAALEAANIMTEVESGDPLAEIKSEFGPLGEFGGMETGVDTDVDEIATTLAELNITPSKTQGGRGTMVEKPGDRAAALSETAVTQEQADEGFLAAMDDFIEAARGAGPEAPKERTIEEYKRVFSEATGIDTSGKVDKKDALMAFGLALMQNKAGKGFNVGKMLQSVGEAGDKALPALQRAKAQARQDGIAAGKYALEMQSADKAKAAAAREKAMARENYYAVPRSEDVKGFLAGIGEGKGRLESLSKYEVDKLLKNPEFASKYDILPGSTWGTVVEEALKTPEGKNLYLDKKVEIPLFEGVTDDLFKIRVYDPDPNSNPNDRPMLAGDGQEQYEALARMARDTQRAKDRFVELGVLAEGTNVFSYSVDTLNRMSSAFGVQFGDKATDTDKMKMILTKLQAKNAPSILGEAGKTISDADRQMVKDIVGDINIMSDPRVLAEKFEGLFNDIIMGAERDIQQGLSTLNRYTNRNIGDAIGSGDLNEDEQAELLAGLKSLGVN